MTKPLSFRCFETSPEIIRMTVMTYVRFPLSLQKVLSELNRRTTD